MGYQPGWLSSGAWISALEAMVAESNMISISSICSGVSSLPSASRILPSGSYPRPVIEYSFPENQTFWTVISFLVSVPVLSVEITLVDPRVSTEESFFTTAFFLANRFTPLVRATVICMGRAWGTTATAIPNP